jgi:hypothetical protein
MLCGIFCNQFQQRSAHAREDELILEQRSLISPYRSLFVQARGVLMLEHLKAKHTIRCSRHASLKRKGLGQIKDVYTCRAPFALRDAWLRSRTRIPKASSQRSSNNRSDCVANFTDR